MRFIITVKNKFFSKFCGKIAIIFRQNCEKSLFFTVIMSLPEFCTGSTGSSGNGGRTAGPNLPSTRAGGQDDGSYTNSLKLDKFEIRNKHQILDEHQISSKHEILDNHEILQQ